MRDRYLLKCWLALSFLLRHVTRHLSCMPSSVCPCHPQSMPCGYLFFARCLHYPEPLQMHPSCFCLTPPGKQLCTHQGGNLIFCPLYLDTQLPHNHLFKSLPSGTEMARLLKCSLRQCKALGLTLQHPHKPGTGEVKTAGFLESAGWPA